MPSRENFAMPSSMSHGAMDSIRRSRTFNAAPAKPAVSALENRHGRERQAVEDVALRVRAHRFFVPPQRDASVLVRLIPVLLHRNWNRVAAGVKMLAGTENWVCCPIMQLTDEQAVYTSPEAMGISPFLCNSAFAADVLGGPATIMGT